ncbi:hypothetical protein CYLTODRAFT_494944 [Cylindrobasidium torrendii FP15055 ss-10]|uniref:Uncharacterized protein n=1 Tax=Cylindrobasidium torrendii FP15055 ss-10 TaxID=1314674 RepID=A0A0D7AXJ0_9AGAR|nr:hypothetical protein CYLTODRAFT_494944 [Cylindrobasidium torrendii FP15055 ss-10]
MSRPDALASYNALLSTSPRPDVTAVLQSIIDAPPFSFDKSARSEALRTILQDLKNVGPKSQSRLTSQDAALALLAVKTLGKNPTGSELLATPATLATLLSFATTFKDEPEAASEALRCIANTLLLFPEARTTFIERQVNGGDVCFNLLDKAMVPDQIFILSRILFLVTVSRSSLIISFVQDKRHGRTIIDVISTKLDILLICLLSGAKLSREAMTDLLKLTFNLLVHYPKLVESTPQPGASQNKDDKKVMGDAWHSDLDSLLAPLLRVFYSLPPTFPSPLVSPLTHTLHALIAIPVTPALAPTWFSTPHSRAASSSSGSPQLVNVGESGSPPRASTLDRALHVLQGRRNSRSPSPHPHITGDVLLRAYDLLEVTFAHYFPGDIDVDDISVRRRPKEEKLDDTLDDIGAPLILLITRLCLSDEAGARTRLRDWLLPADLDRSSPLEQRADTLGRCIRLLSSVYHARLKDSVGEMLFAIANQDPSTLSAMVGYGNVAGFLFNKGILSAPPPPTTDGVDIGSSDGRAINPITGNTMPQPEPEEMTEEEKEAEMDKLFVLFDRLEKVGALPKDQNPIRKAIQQSQQG